MRQPKGKKKPRKPKVSDATDEPAAMDTGEGKVAPAVWRPGQDPIQVRLLHGFEPKVFLFLQSCFQAMDSLTKEHIAKSLGLPSFHFLEI